MVYSTTSDRKGHHGRNVKRIREILGIKQEALARDLGLSQQAVSQLEQKEVLDKETLQKVADALVVPVDAIDRFDESAVSNIFSNTFNDSAVALNSPHSTVNIAPADKLVELYERLLAERDETIADLRRQLGVKGR